MLLLQVSARENYDKCLACHDDVGEFEFDRRVEEHFEHGWKSHDNINKT